MSRAKWIDEVGIAVGSPAAARDWLDNWGAIDTATHRTAVAVRRGGTPVALLANGTDTIPDELTHHGIADDFDHIFCTAFMGVAKPEPAAFLHVCEATALEPRDIFFTDDSPTNVEAAVALGFDAVLYTGVEELRGQLAARSVTLLP